MHFNTGKAIGEPTVVGLKAKSHHPHLYEDWIGITKFILILVVPRSSCYDWFDLQMYIPFSM